MISLVYITRNESDYIERSILSAHDLCDEIIVVDSQSSDNTREICRKLGAKVFWRKWRDDFSYMRNIALEKCQCEWVFSLDADEHIEGENRHAIVEAVRIADQNGIVGYQFPRKNHYPLHEPDSPYFGPPFFPDLQLRLFKRHPDINYSGRVHEGVMASIVVGNVGGIGRIPVTIHHHMFRGDQTKYQEVKEEYYKKLAKGDKV
jgi:glycosyltransferase involved in cell wall biosynthesis